MPRSDEELKELKRIAESARAAWNAYLECQDILQQAFNIDDNNFEHLQALSAYASGDYTFEKLLERIDE